jgi:hypothetical protein
MGEEVVVVIVVTVDPPLRNIFLRSDHKPEIIVLLG